MPTYEYKKIGHIYMPSVAATIKMQDYVSPLVEFIVDSGCGLSLAPSSFIAGWATLPPEEKTPLLDAQGQPIQGSPLSVDIHVAPLPPIREKVYFSSRFHWGLLGQTWFEQVGAHFENFPSADSRLFDLFLPSDGSIPSGPTR